MWVKCSSIFFSPLSLVVMSVVLQPQTSDNFYQSFVAPAWNGSSRRRKSEVKKNRRKNKRGRERETSLINVHVVRTEESLSSKTNMTVITIKYFSCVACRFFSVALPSISQRNYGFPREIHHWQSIFLFCRWTVSRLNQLEPYRTVTWQPMTFQKKRKQQQERERETKKMFTSRLIVSMFIRYLLVTSSCSQHVIRLGIIDRWEISVSRDG